MGIEPLAFRQNLKDLISSILGLHLSNFEILLEDVPFVVLLLSLGMQYAHLSF